MAERFLLHATVSGRVQGIGYRWFVQKAAAGRGLDGWVMNLPGGGVELEASGPKADLEGFLEELKTGHRWASVDDIAASWEPAAGRTAKGFSIKY